MTIKVKFIKDTINIEGNKKKLWKLSQPLFYDLHDEKIQYNYVLTSAINYMNFLNFNSNEFYEMETYIFPADENGDILNFQELDGSFRGEMNHEKAIQNAKWEITDEDF